jgi:hypothetical protein
MPRVATPWGGHPEQRWGQAAVTVTALTRRAGVHPRGGTPRAAGTPRPRPRLPAALSDKSDPPSRRVGPGVGPRASHRSVRAQLRHTARQVTGSHPGYALRGRCGNRGPRLGFLARWLGRGSVTRPSLPSAGRPQGEFPDFHGTIKGSDSYRPVPPDSGVRPAIPPLRRTLRSAGARRTPRQPGVFRFGNPVSRSDGRGRAAGLSGCWGTLVDVRRVLGPRQAPGARPVAASGHGPSARSDGGRAARS